MKTLAIIITAFKAEKYILETLASLKKQSLPSGWQTEFYIGVDACKDTATTLEQNNLSYYYAEENVGTYILTNSLLEEAKKDNCDMFLRFDSDDLARENFLYYGIQHTEKLEFVRPYFNYCTETGKPKGTTNPTIAHGPVFMTRKFLNEVGGYNHFRVACDTDLIERAKILGYNSKITENLPMFYYRRTPGSLTKTKETAKKSEYRNNIIKELELLRRQGNLKIQNPKTVSLSVCK